MAAHRVAGVCSAARGARVEPALVARRGRRQCPYSAERAAPLPAMAEHAPVTYMNSYVKVPYTISGTSDIPSNKRWPSNKRDANYAVQSIYTHLEMKLA